jgi:hypothetical protein
MQGYAEVVAKAKQNTAITDSLPSLLRELCLTPDSLATRVAASLPSFKALAAPQGSDAETALQWLRSRGKVKKGYTIDSLFSSQIPLSNKSINSRTRHKQRNFSATLKLRFPLLNCNGCNTATTATQQQLVPDRQSRRNKGF